MSAIPAVAPENIRLRDEAYSLIPASPRLAAAVFRRLGTMDDAPFFFAAREQDALTLLLPARARAELGDLIGEAPADEVRWRVITFHAEMDWSVVGFLRNVCEVLAEARIPLGAVSTWSRDHVFVRDEQSARALSALRSAAAKGRLS